MTKPRTRNARETKISKQKLVKGRSNAEMHTRTRTHTNDLPVEEQKSYVGVIVDEYAHVLTPVESQIIQLVVVERVPLHECAGVLNLAQQTEAWTDVRVSRTLARAREKLQRAGELEASKPDALVAQETRVRYDDVIGRLRRELRTLEGEPMLAGVRAKMLKTVAEVERMREDALQALSGKPSATANALVYVSHLRSDSSSGQNAPPPTPPGGA